MRIRALLKVAQDSQSCQIRPYDNPAARSSSTSEEGARRSSRATGVVASFVESAPRIASAFDAPNAATMTRLALARTESVSVRRRAGGLGES